MTDEEKTMDEKKQFYIYGHFFPCSLNRTRIFIFLTTHMLQIISLPGRHHLDVRGFCLASLDISTAKVDSVFTSLHHTSLPSWFTLLTFHQCLAAYSLFTTLKIIC